MSGDLKLGQIIDVEKPERDAIHIAVAPVVAANRLHPGEHVGFIGTGTDYRVDIDADKLIGVVDPFLRRPVQPGQRCWLFLYPNTITALRHEWTHPAFQPTAEPRAIDVTKTEAERWLRAFADEWSIPYREMIDGAVDGEGITARDRDIHSWDELGDRGALFWRNLEIVTGKKFDAHHREQTYFSCSC